MQPAARTDEAVLASYSRYADAQAAVDRLSDAKFPVEQTSIVGRDLRLVESVTGRLDYRRAALSGLAGGAWFGLLVGLFLAIFAADDGASWIALVLWGLVFGAIAGTVFSLVAYSATGGRRDFVSTSALVAERYDVLVSGGSADQARQLLGVAAPAGQGLGGPVPGGPVAGGQQYDGPEPYGPEGTAHIPPGDPRRG